jgi:hypothetical protein
MNVVLRMQQCVLGATTVIARRALAVLTSPIFGSTLCDFNLKQVEARDF